MTELEILEKIRSDWALYKKVGFPRVRELVADTIAVMREVSQSLQQLWDSRTLTLDDAYFCDVLKAYVDANISTFDSIHTLLAREEQSISDTLVLARAVLERHFILCYLLKSKDQNDRNQKRILLLKLSTENLKERENFIFKEHRDKITPSIKTAFSEMKSDVKEYGDQLNDLYRAKTKESITPSVLCKEGFIEKQEYRDYQCLCAYTHSDIELVLSEVILEPKELLYADKVSEVSQLLVVVIYASKSLRIISEEILHQRNLVVKSGGIIVSAMKEQELLVSMAERLTSLRTEYELHRDAHILRHLESLDHTGESRYPEAERHGFRFSPE